MHLQQWAPVARKRHRSLSNHFYFLKQECLQPVTLNSAFKLHNKVLAGAQWFLFKNGTCATNHFESGGFVKSDPGVSHPDIALQFVPVVMREAGESDLIQHGYQVHCPLRPCLQGGRVSLLLGLPQQEGYPSTPTFLLFFFIDVFTSQVGLPWH